MKSRFAAALRNATPWALAVLLTVCATSPDFPRPEPISATAYTATAVPGETVGKSG